VLGAHHVHELSLSLFELEPQQHLRVEHGGFEVFLHLHLDLRPVVHTHLPVFYLVSHVDRLELRNLVHFETLLFVYYFVHVVVDILAFVRVETGFQRIVEVDGVVLLLTGRVVGYVRNVVLVSYLRVVNLFSGFRAEVHTGTSFCFRFVCTLQKIGKLLVCCSGR